jgi:hypothetical protein
MSNNEDVSFWRIYRAGAEDSQEEIKDGEAIRMCWCFSDQTAGYRDYVDDTFGRRRVLPPPGVPDRLFMKVPFPRFENISILPDSTLPPISLIMSSANTMNPILEAIQVAPEDRSVKDTESITYNLHDSVLRIDAVGELLSWGYSVP